MNMFEINALRYTRKTLIVSTVLAVVVLLYMSFCQKADAQTADEAAGPSTLVNISVRPKTVTAVPFNTPGEIDLGSLDVQGLPVSLTEDVTVKAFTRYVDYKGRKIGQVVLSGVERDGNIEPLPASVYSAQFDLETPQLDPAREVMIEADATALSDALRKLAQMNKDKGATPRLAQSSDNDDANPENGSNGADDSQASAYEPPSALNVAPEAQEVVSITTEGCTIRIDQAQGKAIQQSRTVTSKNGAVASGSECTDSETGFPLEKSYSVCEDDVDIDALTATGQYLLFYTDAGGSRQEVTACGPDSEKIFTIVEDFDSCTVYMDYVAKEAVTRSLLTYQDDNNSNIQVRGCQASDTVPAVELAATTDGCAIRHDFAADTSYQQGTNVYLKDGIQYMVGGCIDTETQYAHTAAYEDAAGNSLCSTVVDLAQSQATLQNRVQIVVDGVTRYISECTPDINGALALTATTDGCTNVSAWEHDLTTGQSFGQERHYYVSGGNDIYVNDCQNSLVTYAHQQENTGWQNHDDQLFAWSLDTVYITPPTGRHDVAVSEVLSGAEKMPYTLSGTETIESGTVTYEECGKYLNTQDVENWKRPDQSTYQKPVGEGTPTGPGDACTLQVSTTWNLKSTYVRPARDYCKNTARDDSSVWYTDGSRRYGVYEGVKTLIREDGVTISTQTGIGSEGCSTSCGTPPPACSATNSSVGSITGWRNGLGWW